MSDVAQQHEQVGAVLGIEVARGLVGQQHRGAADQGAGERGPLALGGGQHGGPLVAAVGQPDPLEQGVDGLGLGRAARDQQRQRDVLAHGDGGEDGGGGEEEADLVAPHAGELEVVELAQRAPVEDHAAAGGAVEAGDQVEQGGLARARGADNGGELPGGRLDRHVAEHVDAGAEVTHAMEEIVRNDSRHAGTLPSPPTPQRTDNRTFCRGPPPESAGACAEGLVRLCERRLDQRPYERPITSSMISSVPAPIRFSRRSRHTRSIPYSFM